MPATLPPTRPRSRIAVAVLAHIAVGTYSGFGAPLITVLDERADLSAMQAAWLLGLGAFSSGIVQPICSVFTDRLNTRILAPIGLIVAAVGMSCVGIPRSIGALFLFYVIGTLGIGAFNPVAAASIGQLASGLSSRGRSIGVGLFYAAGLIGGIVGSLVAPLFAAGGESGLRWMSAAMIPGLALALLLHFAIRNIDHRDLATPDRAQSREHGRNVLLLMAVNALRFTTHLSLVYLFIRHADLQAANMPGDFSANASHLSGIMMSVMLIGMAAGSMGIGSRIRPGREKWWLVLWPLLTWPVIVLFPSIAGGSVATAAIGACIAAIAFASMIPATVTVAQRLWPHRTSLASSLTLGAWAVSVLGPPAAELVLKELGWNSAFALAAAVLALSGLLALLLDTRLIRDSAQASPAH